MHDKMFFDFFIRFFISIQFLTSLKQRMYLSSAIIIDGCCRVYG